MIVAQKAVSDGAGWAWFRAKYWNNNDPMAGLKQWTMSVTARAVDTDNAAIVGFGHQNNTNNLCLASAGAGKVSLSVAQKQETHVDVITAEVPGAAMQFHNYTVTFDGVDTLELFVDGKSAGTWSGFAGGMQGNEVNFGRSNSNERNGFSNGYGVAIDDFRIYEERLSAEQIAAIAAANAPWPEAGLPAPKNWYALDGEFGDKDDRGRTPFSTVQSAQPTLRGSSADAENVAAVWESSMDGERTALRTQGQYANFRASTSGDNDWTINIVGRVRDVEKACLVGFGHPNNTNNLAIAAGAAGKVNLCIEQNNTDNSTVIASADVEDRSGRYHVYTIVHSSGENTLKFYADGVKAGEYKEFYGGMQGNEVNIARGYNVWANRTGGWLTNDGGAVADLRVYDVALGDEQVATLADVFAEETPCRRVVAVPDGSVLAVPEEGMSVDAIEFEGSAKVNYTIGTVDASRAYTVIASGEDLELGNVELSLTNGGYESAFFADGGNLMLGVAPAAAVRLAMNGEVKQEGTQGNLTLDGWDEGCRYIGSADGASGAIVAGADTMVHIKGNIGTSSYDEDVWTVAMSVRSVDTVNAIIAGFGYNNGGTKNDWGILSAGKDKMKFAYWQNGANALEGEVEFDVPEAALRFHEIVLVHPKDTTYAKDEGTVSLKIYVDGELVKEGHYYNKWFKLEDGTQTGGNDAMIGGFAGGVHKTSDHLGVLKRGDGVAVNDLRIYKSALGEMQVRMLAEKFFPAWPQMTSVAAGETVTINGKETWTDRLLKLESGATIAMAATGSLVFAKEFYDLDRLLITPDEGVVTVALADAQGQEGGVAYTLIDDVTDIVFNGWTVDRTGVGGAFHPKLMLEGGNLAGMLCKVGFLLIVR